MAEIKTKKTTASVEDFLNSIPDEKKRADGFKLLEIFEKITKEKPAMWGTSIIGFGNYHYKSTKSSQEGDWFYVGFSARKQNLSLYVSPYRGFIEDELPKLGKHKASMGCLYINKLADVDMNVLEELIAKAYKGVKENQQHFIGPQ